MILGAPERRFIESRRVAHLATADAAGVPQVVPVCFALGVDTAYIAIDAKPKRGPPTALKRLRNIAANPAVALVFDHYEEEWARLGWVMLRGRATVLEGAAALPAQALLKARYAQYAAMDLAGLPVIAIHIETARSWGQLAKDIPP